MMRMLQPGRVLRYGVYLSLIGTIFVTVYALLRLISGTGGVYSLAGRGNVPIHLVALDSQLSYMGEYLDVKYRLLEHVDYMSKGQIILTNRGKTPITKGNWSMYIFYMSPIDTDMFNYEYGGIKHAASFRMYRVQGNLYRMTPSVKMEPLLPNGQLVLNITSGTWILAYSDILPNWYVWAPDLEPRILKSTRETETHPADFVELFKTPSSLLRTDGDPLPPYTPSARYLKNKLRFRPDIGLPVLPTPAEVKYNEDSESFITIGKDWVIVNLSELDKEAKVLSKLLDIAQVEKSPKSKVIMLTIGNVPLRGKFHMSDAYSIQVQDDTIIIIGQSPNAVYYAVQSFLSIYEPLPRRFPSVIVLDAPRFKYRGMMVDLSRNFHSNVTELKRLIKGMSMYKMNRLHLHLGDDEGWRLEIPGLPELTHLGGYRCHDLRENACILPALGSGPFTNSSGSGYLSVVDYESLLKYASENYVEVIPEFDMPGHGRAAIRSMGIRYDRYMSLKDPNKAKEFLLSDPTDRSYYMSGQFFTDNAINPCMESTYRFVEHLIIELKKLHEPFQPLKRFHFGGDEVPENAFMESPICSEYMASHPELMDTRDLKIHFIKRIAAIAARHNLGLQGWEDAFYGKEILPMTFKNIQDESRIVTNVWWNMWEGGIGHRSNELANHDYQVVLSHATHFYFDHVQEPDPAERGLFWAIRYIDTKRVFGYIADDIFENIDLRGMGVKWNREDACAQVVNCVGLEKPQNVIGLQAQLWSETVRTRSQQNYMIFPRILALAERAWHRPSWELMENGVRKEERDKDWARFVSLFGEKESKRLEELDIHYRLPPPGVMVTSEGQMHINTEYPGLPVQYSQDDGQTWHEWDSKLKPTGYILIATRSHDGRRRSRPIQISI